jgi:predicted AlkP superfamily pyrophosphatase or phosphodiesterase
MGHKLLVLSADAMVREDMEQMRTLPNFKRYLAGGAEVKTLRSIYPTVTYPVHVSIATGRFADSHGVVSNYELHPGVLAPPWNWFHNPVKGPDIFDAAKKAGLSTAAVFWPVTGNHPSIDHLITEYWTQLPGESLRDVFARSGSGEGELAIVEKNKTGMVERSHPGYDQFIINCSCDIIRQYRPDLLFIHVANIDDYRHKNGVFNEKVTRGVDETDVWIGELYAAMAAAGVADDTDFFLISDHGQLDIRRIINFNVLFADHGLIRSDAAGKISGWDAYSLSNGLSALVYLKDPTDQRLYEKVYALLRHWRDEGIYGIGRIFAEPEARAEQHLGGPFSFVLETDGYTAFGDDWKRPLVKTFDFSDYRYGRATHGHLPAKGPQPVLAAKGRGLRNNVALEERNVVDLAPTFAKLLNLSLPGTDGRCIEELLN